MVRIRLRRVGFRNQPSYRIVAADKEKPRDGRFLENLGFYNPRTEPATIQIDEGLVYKWLKNGAKPSESVEQIFNTVGLYDRYEKYKSGTELQKVIEEAREYYENRKVDARTRRDAVKSE